MVFWLCIAIFYRFFRIFFNFWLIKSTKQDPFSGNGLKITSENDVGSNKKKAKIWAQILIFLLFVSIFTPLHTEAGIFSFISGFFSSSSNTEEELPNSQNMALLQATLSPDPKSASSTRGDIAILSDTSILPEAQGPFSDGKDHSTNTDQISLYVVRSGDTLPAIAKMFGISTNTIVWANDLKGNSVSVGQTLVIMPITGIQYTVKSGDTLKAIVSKYKGDLDEVMQYNNLTLSSKLVVGDIIFIPDGDYVSTSNTTKPSSGGSSQSSTPSYNGYYMRPIIGGVKTQGIHGHNGVDLASSFGAKIMAAADGTVIIAKSGGWNGGYGSYVVIKHDNGTQTLYGHLSSVAVTVGQSVKQGQTIGGMGSTGKSTGVHLHFEVRGAKNPF